MGRASIVGGTFKPVLQPRLKTHARTGRHKFFQQRRLLCDSNWRANLVKSLKGTLLPVEPTLYWLFNNKVIFSACVCRLNVELHYFLRLIYYTRSTYLFFRLTNFMYPICVYYQHLI